MSNNFNDAPNMGGLVKDLGGDTTDKSVYTVRGLWEIACCDLPPLDCIWNGIARIPGAVVEIIGPPSIGKSRFLGDLARHQILGREFGGRATSRESIKWLFAGSENGINRINFETVKYLFHMTPAEVRGMSEADRLALAAQNGYTEADVRALDANFRTFTLENPEDFDISLMDEKNIAKFVKTLKREKPDILSVDPWGDVIAGEELKDGDVRQTIRILRGCLAKAEITKTLLVVVNHARMGAREEANARGADEGNFGKNSKCIYSIARYVINIRRASFDDSPDIEIINAKNNDGKKQPPLALRLDPDTMSYNLVPDFDHDAWQDELDEAAGNGKKKNGGRTKEDKDEIGKAVEEVLATVDDGIIGYEDLISVLQNDHNIGKTAAENYVSSCINTKKTLKKTRRMKEGKDGTWTADGNKSAYGLPATVERYQRTHRRGEKTDESDAPKNPVEAGADNA